jgi:hypothetical protein
MRVTQLGAQTGAASSMKMCQGGLAKGLITLFLEMSLTAREAHLLDEFLSSCQHFYPGVVEAVARQLHTYPRHAQRRASEMRELETTMESLGLRAGIATEIRSFLESLAASGLSEQTAGLDLGAATLCELVELIGREKPLSAESAKNHKDETGAGLVLAGTADFK